jgi:hypothetical protein
MAKDDRGRADARFTRPGATKLKALRLAREAAEPPAPVKKTRTRSPKKPGDKSPALSDWLAGQHSGGRRT